jgi:hypothetical protein
MACRNMALSVLASLLLTGPPALAFSSPASTDGWIPGVGHATGSTGTFQTDLWIFNPSSENPTDVTLEFHLAEADGTAPAAEVTEVIAPRETRLFSDFTTTEMNLSGTVLGNLHYTSDAGNVMVAARIYTAQPSGTFGFFQAGIPSSEALGPRSSSDDTVDIWQMYGLTNDASFRTNVDVTNTSPFPVTVILNVVEPESSLIINNAGAGQTATLLPYSNHRFSDVLNASNVGSTYVNAPALRVTVAVPETENPAAGVFAVASVLDTRTSDGYLFPGERQSATTQSPMERGVLSRP